MRGKFGKFCYKITRFPQKLLKILISQRRLIIVTIILTLVFLFYPSFFISASYQVTEDFLNYGGGYGTSTNYILIDSIGYPREYASHYVEPPPNIPDQTPPSISNVQVSEITYTSAKVTWTTNEPSTSRVDYGLTINYEIGYQSNSLTVLDHSITLTNLSTSTLYHFRVRSTDSSANEAISGDYTFQTLTPPDTTPPIISNITVSNVTDTSVQISWQTDELADSLIDYGLTTSYGLTASSTSLVTSHSFTLLNLNRGTTYHFKITSKDAANNSASTSDLTFQTTDSVPPQISNLTVIDITPISAKVSWQTDEPADSTVDYGLTTNYELGSVRDNSLATNHLIPLTRLLPNTQYHFRVHSKDSFNNETISSDQAFRTLKDNIPPANVSNFSVSSGDSLNILTWTNPSDVDFVGVLIKRSILRYPTTPTDGETIFDGLATSFTDRGLTNGTTYYYTIFAYDTSGNYASGALGSGTPTAPPPPPPPQPEEVPPIPPQPPSQVPPGAPGALPPEEVPGIPPGMPSPAVIIPEVTRLSDFEFYLANRTILVYPDEFSQITTLVGHSLSVLINQDKFVVSPQLLTLNIGTSNYFFASSTAFARFESDFSAPSEPGEYEVIITVFYPNSRATQTKFKLIVKPKGIIFQTEKGEQKPLSNARITLYSKTSPWKVWEASKYNQENPQITSENGEFGFVVPNGLYYLKVEKEGFRTRETDRFEVFNNVINSNIELFEVPPPLKEVINPEAPLIENVKNVTKNLVEKSAFATKVVTEKAVDIAQNPTVEKANEQIAAPTIATVSVVNTVMAVNVFNLGAYLQYLLMQPVLLLQRRKRLGWGVVYNSLSKLPIDLAIVRLINQNTGRIVQTRVTDKEGRYLLMAEPGLFRIETTKKGFIFPTVYLKDFKEDAGYTDLYHGEPLEVKEKGAVITVNIPLDPIEEKPSKTRLIWQQIFRGIQYGLSIASIILAGISMIISPTVHTYIIFGGQILLFLFFLRLAKPPKPKGWGIVYDKLTGRPLARAVVRIFETQFNKLVGSQVTDRKGRYAFLTGRNVYYVASEKEGYEEARTPEIDLRQKGKVELVAPDIPMSKKEVKTEEPKNQKTEVRFGDRKLDYTDLERI